MQGLEPLYAEYGADGFLPISVVGQDRRGLTPTQQDAELWATELELAFPVLADVDGTFWPVWNPREVLPMAYIIDRDGVLVWKEAGGAGGLGEMEAVVVETLTAL